jgi:hypothetical protein
MLARDHWALQLEGDAPSDRARKEGSENSGPDTCTALLV